MARVTSELVVRLLDQVTGPAKGAAKAIKGIGAARDAVNQRLGNLRGSMVEAVGVGVALTSAIRAPIQAAIDFESQMADVKKVVDFPSPKAFEDMKGTLLDMSKTLPVSVSGLAEITAAAGQAGIAGKELLPFVEGAAKVGTAFDISAKEAGEALSKMRAGLGMTNEQVFSLADAMNHLSNAQASSAAEILDVVRRVGAQATGFGYTAEQVSAFASAMIAAGAQSDVAATSFRNMGLALTKGGGATKAQREAFGKLGLDSVKVAKRMQKDAVGVTMDVIKRLGKLPKYMQSEVASALFGNEAHALQPLLTNTKLLEESLGLIADKAKYAGSSQREFEARAATTANAIQIFQNRLTGLSISIGSALLPALNSVMAGFSPIVDSVTAFARENPRLTATVVGLTASLIALRVAAIGAQFSLLWMKGGALTVAAAGAQGMSAAVGALGAAFTAMRNPARTAALAQVAQAKASVQQAQSAYQAAQATQKLAAQGLIAGVNMKDATANLRAAGQASVQAQQGLLAANTALAATSRGAAVAAGAMRVLKVAVVGTGIGAVLVGIALAGTFIYNNWRGISTAFEAFKGAFSRAIEPIRPALEPVIGLFSTLGGWISNITGRVDPLGGKWAALGITIGKSLGEAVVSVVQKGQEIAAFFTNLPATLTAIDWTSVTAGLIAELVAVPMRLAMLPADILAIFTGIDLAGAARDMIQTFIAGVKNGLVELAGYVKSKLKDMFTVNVSLPSWLGGSGGAPAASGSAPASAPAVDGARARGGPVEVGKTYLVGETQPEFFTPHADGFITPMSEAGSQKGSAPSTSGGAAPSRAAPRAGASLTYAPNITISAAQDMNQIRQMLDERERDAMARWSALSDGAFSDS